MQFGGEDQHFIKTPSLRDWQPMLRSNSLTQNYTILEMKLVILTLSRMGGGQKDPLLLVFPL